MDPKIVQQNALLLWNYPDYDFTVGNENDLIVLSPWRVFSQLNAWWDPEGTTEKVKEVITQTFKEIYKMNEEGKLPTVAYNGKKYFYVWKYEWYLTKFYPADYLAQCVMSRKRYCDQRIIEAATMVKQQAGIYPSLSEGYTQNADSRISRNIHDSIGVSFFRRGLNPN